MDGLHCHALPAPFDVDPLELHRRAPDRYPFLLQSTAAGTPQGQFDLLFAFPGERLTLSAPVGRPGGPRFLEALDERWRAERTQVGPPAGLPFGGGWFLLLGYELAGEIEPRLALAAAPEWPAAVAVRVPVAWVRDRRSGSAWVIAEPGSEAEARQVLDDLRAATPEAAASQVLTGAVYEPPAEDFIRAVGLARAHIAAGDIFQANLSREWRAELVRGTTAADLYARLRSSNPAPFAGLAVLDEVAVISSSPERLARVHGGRIDTRPIAGTRPRLAGDEDSSRRAELLSHPKERAEHVMLIDLERNDLGRLCQPGTVQVDEFMVVETYAHVHHIVSNVTGTLRPGVTPGDMLRAVFPGGTITGCPKVRCMEIIRELERRPRGFYTGSMGYLNRDGSGDLNILIRTLVLADRTVSLAAGAGIVADSDPQRELEETRAKAKGVLLALE